MRLNQAKSMFLGLAVFALFFLVFLYLGIEKGIIFLFLSFFLGGFIAMYFVRERKIQYLFYEEILIFIFSLIISTITSSPLITRLNIYGFILLFLSILIFTGLGGLIGKKLADKKSDKKVWRFHPVISIIIGFVTSYIIFAIIFYFTLSGALDSVFPQMLTVANVCSLVIGGFIATYFAKEKKIRYGIYLGTIWVVSIGGLIPNLFFAIPTSPSAIVNTILRYIIFIMAPMIGSYLAILITKHQKLKKI